jgi:hypothetical protein
MVSEWDNEMRLSPLLLLTCLYIPLWSDPTEHRSFIWSRQNPFNKKAQVTSFHFFLQSYLMSTMKCILLYMYTVQKPLGWVSEWVIIVLCQLTNFSTISWWEQVNFQWDDAYSASSLKQPSADRHVTPLGHIILTPSRPVFALITPCCMLSKEATNTNFIVFGLTRSGFEPMIYHTRGEHANHYTTNAVQKPLKLEQ